MRAALASLLLFALTVAVGAPANAGSRDCSAWQALYAAPDDDNGRITVEFMRGEGTGPHPLNVTALDASGKRAWHHTGHYWCYQGSGGCYVGLGYKDKAQTEDESANALRIVFANADPKMNDPDRAADILVIAGMNSAFFYGQNDGGLVIDHADGSGEPVFVPEVFYFARCRAK